MTATDPAPFEVRPKQTYVPCRPPTYAYPGKPFVVTRVVADKVEVWDPSGGTGLGGYRWVALRNLHESGTTKQGKERKTGWRLHCQPPADPARQELCGGCFTWFDREEFAVVSLGWGHSTCKPCTAEIERLYSAAEPARES
ncbi:hypothetical protein [Streptomyces sp. cg35]|uniref:hypothetical protein n=1 Tax=Streptomyces sp. cg35 TaxID=3421650 RepID=UPI003D187498